MMWFELKCVIFPIQSHPILRSSDACWVNRHLSCPKKHYYWAKPCILHLDTAVLHILIQQILSELYCSILPWMMSPNFELSSLILSCKLPIRGPLELIDLSRLWINSWFWVPIIKIFTFNIIRFIYLRIIIQLGYGGCNKGNGIMGWMG